MPQIPIANASGRKKGAPQAPKPFELAEVRLGNSQMLPGRHSVWAQIDLTAPQSAGERADVDLAPVIDCSGSMGRGAGSPREHAFDAVRYLLKRLGGQDRSALVLYDDHVEVVKGLDSDHQLAIEKLKHVSFGGMTALADGLYSGLEQLSGKRAKERNVACFLLSDGLANQGDVDPDVITRKVKKAAKAGIKVSTFGLGQSYDEDLLEAIASAGGGGYYYIASPDDAPQAFAAELEGLLAVTARSVRLDVTPAQGVTLQRVFGLDADSVPVQVGDLAAEATRTLLIELECEGTDGDSVELFELSLSYSDLDGQPQAETHSVSLAVTDDADAVAHGVDVGVIARVAEMEAAYAQAQAAKLADQGQYDQARALVGQQRQQLSGLMAQAAFAASPAMLSLLGEKERELAVNASWLENAGTYTASSAKLMKSSSYSTRNSRPQSAPSGTSGAGTTP